MAESASTTSPNKPTGKTFNFNLVGDDLFLYETVRDCYQGDAEDEEERFAALLEGLDAEARSLVRSRMAPKPKKQELSHRQVFVRALTEARAAHEAASDAADAMAAADAEDTGSDTPADNEDEE